MENNANQEKIELTVNGANHSLSESAPTGIPSSSPIALSTTCTPNASKTASCNAHNMSTTSLTSEAQKGIPSDYVFGSNISSRVVNADVSRGASSDLWTSTGNGSTSSVFTTLAKAVTAAKTNSKDSKNLEDSAKEVVEDKRRETLNLAEVDLVTGEEGEIPVIRQHCRAYVFDANKQKWNNLGAVHFHLNDIPNDKAEGYSNPSSRSRIVVRLVSTRKLVINTVIWSQIPVALVDPRNLRIGAVNDDGHIKSYLFAFPQDDLAAKIYELLCLRKSNTTTIFPLETNSNKSPGVNKEVVTGCKRQFETEATSDSDHLPHAPAKVASTSVPLPTANLTVFPKTNIFRPSVFTPSCQDTSNGAPVSNLTAHTGELQFRNSPLDNVVKRLYESNPSGSAEPPTLPNNTKIVDSPKLSSNVSSKSMSISSVSNNRCADFVFGHNVSERVTNTSTTTGSRDTSRDLPSESPEPNVRTLSPESEEPSDASEVGEHFSILPSKQTLEESAAAVASEMLEKSTYLLANLPESPILTGEEGEYLTLKAYCHFYCFDRHKHEWVGRGQAYIHLNDVAMKPSTVASQMSPFPSGPPARSRLVIRTCQTLKLLANVPVWSGLNVTMADERSIRLTTVCHPSEKVSESPNKVSYYLCEFVSLVANACVWCNFLLSPQ
ncbi:unnamed protein product [Trichobilharzia regenti]|nr:unnamed protein product [Trichobilharzia regenti]